MSIKSTYKNSSLDFQAIREWFISYVETYYSDDKFYQTNMVLKRNHSFRVAALAGKIATELELATSEKNLAQIIGLLHDVARFEQFQNYKTFRDDDSFDHGQKGVEIITAEKELNALLTPEIGIISKALFWHNKIALDKELSGRELLHCQLIRDADKLDICKIFCEMLNEPKVIAELGTIPKDSVYNKIADDVSRGVVTGHAQIKNNFDFYLQKVSWVYDFNFVPSLKLLRERGYLTAMQNVFPKNSEISSMFTCVYTYLNEKILKENTN